METRDCVEYRIKTTRENEQQVMYHVYLFNKQFTSFQLFFFSMSHDDIEFLRFFHFGLWGCPLSQ